VNRRPAIARRVTRRVVAALLLGAAYTHWGAWIEPAAAVSVTSEEVRLQSGKRTLRAVLQRPVEGSDRIGIVLLPGDGPLRSASVGVWSDTLAARGFAVLALETADSLGDPRVPRTGQASRMGEDVAAALRSLRAHDAVGDVAGVITSGQATWVVPHVAAHDSLVAFVVALSGGPLPLADQELYRRKQKLAADGYGRANVERGGSVVWIYFEYLKSYGAARAENVHGEYERYRNEPWFPLLELPSEDPTVGEWPQELQDYALALNYDPVPVFATLTSPLLAILGSNDRVIPAGPTARAYESLEKPDVTVRTLDGADHELNRSASEASLATEVYRIVGEWIRSTVSTSR
jgi:dienelactone hydrolase